MTALHVLARFDRVRELARRTRSTRGVVVGNLFLTLCMAADDAVIAALNGSAGDHLRDLGRARIHIEARSAEESIVCGRNLNQAASECRAPREEAGNA